jgi:hypothetical protein
MVAPSGGMLPVRQERRLEIRTLDDTIRWTVYIDIRNAPTGIGGVSGAMVTPRAARR